MHPGVDVTVIGILPKTKHQSFAFLSGQIIIFHQPRFPWNKGISLTKPPFGVRSGEVAIIWPDSFASLWDAMSFAFFTFHFVGTSKLGDLPLKKKVGKTNYGIYTPLKIFREPENGGSGFGNYHFQCSMFSFQGCILTRKSSDFKTPKKFWKKKSHSLYTCEAAAGNASNDPSVVALSWCFRRFPTCKSTSKGKSLGHKTLVILILNE